MIENLRQQNYPIFHAKEAGRERWTLNYNGGTYIYETVGRYSEFMFDTFPRATIYKWQETLWDLVIKLNEHRPIASAENPAKEIESLFKLALLA